MNCFSPDEGLPPVADCGTLAQYIPQPADPVKTVKIAFHVMQREAPFEKDNFDENNTAHVAFLNGLASRVNDLYSWCNVQWCNCAYQNGLGQERDSRIRFELTGIYYHRDNVGHINEDATYHNRYCYDNYAVCKDEILNVFFCQIPNSTSGYGPPSHVMMFNLYNEYTQQGGDTWGPGNLLGHEFGHVFGLGHSWQNKFADMCQQEANGAKWCENRETDCSCGNNMMSYSRLSDYISPLQMARMHLTLMTTSVSKYLVLEKNSTPITITQPTVWNTARICNSDVFIEPDASLTIQCKVVMAAGTRIVTKRGARLIVDGARISTKGRTQSVCNGITNVERWDGIEVWGNTAVATTTNMLNENYALQSTDPGVVTLKNGAIIEHAYIGVQAQQNGTAWNVQQQHFGGLISTNGAEFRNCRKAVAYISDKPIKNSSTFNNCKFTQSYLDTSIVNPAKSYEGVTSWQVGQLTFSNCRFNYLERGIVLGNATATVLGSLFLKNKWGIEMGMAAPMAGAQTYIGGDGSGGNTFRFTEWPVYAKSTGYLLVKNNDFLDCPVGVVLEGTSIYRIEENLFQNTNPVKTDTFVFVVGIGLIQTGEASSNDITCNEYKAVIGNDTASGPLIREGIFAGGNNNGSYFDKNKFNCWYDVRLSQYTDIATNTVYKGELPNQGGFGNPVHNRYTKFSLKDHKAEIHTPAPSLGVTANFDYHHPSGICGVLQMLPRKSFQGSCSAGLAGFYFTNVNAGSASSPTCSFGPINLIPKPEDCRTLACLSDYYLLIQQRDSLLKPGDSPALYTAIQASPSAIGTLSALTGASPYLSEGVLAAAAASAMSGTDKVTVLAANLPLSPYIKNLAEQHLSTAQYDSLVAQEQPEMTSLRDAVIGERKYWNNQKMALLRHLTDSLFEAGNVAGADALLAADPERFSREARVGLRFQTADYTGAAQLIASYPEFTLADTEFRFIQTLNLARAISDTLPSSADSAALFQIALGYSPQAGYAKTLAGILYGTLFEPYIPPAPEDPEEELREESPQVSSAQAASTDASNMRVFPNPASETLTVVLPEAQERDEILLFDLQGRLLLRRTAAGPNTTLDITSLRAGFYLVSWATDGVVRAGRYFVKTKI